MQHELPYNSGYPSTSRPAAPPPAYTRFVQRMSLRPVLLFTTLIGAVYLIIIAAGEFRAAGEDNLPGNLKTVNIVQGALFLGAAGIELFGFVAAYTIRLPLARTYSLLSVAGVAAIAAAQLLGIVTHWTSKAAIIDSCTTRNTGRSQPSDSYWIWEFNDTDNGAPLTDAQARSFCERRWNSQSAPLIIAFVLVLLLGLLLVFFSFAFVRQISDPSAAYVGRGRTQVAPSATHYQQSTPYDGYAQGPYSYPPGAGAPGVYQPPAGAPPGYGGRQSEDWEDDYKTPGGPHDTYAEGRDNPYGDNQAVGRPGSSRGAYTYGDDERHKSDDTLRGQDEPKGQQTSGTRVSDAPPRI
ncbi:hypothetical protein CBOM_00883 [Ceraceosorus bombacis]|uniref:Uncharacterized protein n=1 Tax=Ceraceosorus bombacis TaxID=401625 RepID=A0A0P1BAK4_9BASI|nr:hypothetical protein CBOM_00883 [Ceraceosorus bombacis]